MRFIDADAFLISQLKIVRAMETEWQMAYWSGVDDTLGDIADAPTIDAVPVVRCKDCKHYIDAHSDGSMYCMRPLESDDYSETGYMYPLEVPVRDTDFCNYGEPKGESEE